jgi:hypothetical protein
MTPIEHWKTNVDGQKALEKFLNEYGEEFLAVARQQNQPKTSSAAGLEAMYENNRMVERWQGFENALNALSDLTFTALNGPTGQKPLPRRLIGSETSPILDPTA